MELFKIAQMAGAYSQSLLAFATDTAPRPFSASFAVSNSCNIHCSYCNFPNMDLTELDLGTIKLIFERLKKAGVKRLGLLGGEPLLRRDILDIIHLAKEQGFFISLNTNLLLYDKYKERLGDIDYFFTSLDGSPGKHEKNRGKQNYDKIIRSIQDIVARKKPVSAICVVTDPDISEAQYLLDLASAESFTVHFQPECYDTEIVLRSAPAQSQDSRIKEYWLWLAAKKRNGAPIASSVSYLNYISEWHDYSISSFYDGGHKCAAGRGFLFVDAQGIAYPCAYTKGKVPGLDLTKYDYSFDKKTPCTKCIVGPMLEFNLLFQKPFSAVINALNNI